jgi:glycosyltransferase involved in cell wall biosynthesis
LLSGAVATIIGGHRDVAAIAMLETMACGTPPVAADTPILREIAANTGCLGTAEEQAAGLVNLQQEDEAQRAARLRGNLSRAQRHDWPRLAEQTLGVYRAVLAGEALPTEEGGGTRP